MPRHPALCEPLSQVCHQVGLLPRLEPLSVPRFGLCPNLGAVWDTHVVWAIPDSRPVGAGRIELARGSNSCAATVQDEAFLVAREVRAFSTKSPNIALLVVGRATVINPRADIRSSRPISTHRQE